jgi:hypothetical protein
MKQGLILVEEKAEKSSNLNQLKVRKPLMESFKET